jgi:chromosome segregation ATPase
MALSGQLTAKELALRELRAECGRLKAKLDDREAALAKAKESIKSLKGELAAVKRKADQAIRKLETEALTLYRKLCGNLLAGGEQ